MKPTGRPRKLTSEAIGQAIERSTIDVSHQCPTLHQLTDSGEFNLLDLPRLQTDIERLLASVTQCMTCISNELKGKSIPTPILRSVGLVDADPNNRPTHPSEMTHIGGEPTHAQATSNCSPLSVTANPDKPLSLIISSNKKQSPESSTADAEGFPKASTSRSNEMDNAPPPSSPNPPNSANDEPPEPIPSSCHDIPNRFWALMEPYCADITESNISYLEGILKSYVEEATTAKYFASPPSNCLPKLGSHSPHPASAAEYQNHHNNNPIHPPKRLRRDASQNDLASSCSSNDDNVYGALKAASEMVTLARHIDGQLKAPKLPALVSAEAVNAQDLVASLEADLYEENVSSILRAAVARMVQGRVGSLPLDDGGVLASDSPAGSSSSQQDSSSSSPPFMNLNSSATTTILPGGLCARGASLTAICSQPLRNLARHFQVSSSFRVEKKIDQAREELGLLPLTLHLNHLSHRPEKLLLPVLSHQPQSHPSNAVDGTAVVKTEPTTVQDNPGDSTTPAPVLNGVVQHSPVRTPPAMTETSPNPHNLRRSRNRNSSSEVHSPKPPKYQTMVNGVAVGGSPLQESPLHDTIYPCDPQSRKNGNAVTTETAVADGVNDAAGAVDGLSPVNGAARVDSREPACLAASGETTAALIEVSSPRPAHSPGSGQQMSPSTHVSTSRSNKSPPHKPTCNGSIAEEETSTPLESVLSPSDADLHMGLADQHDFHVDNDDDDDLSGCLLNLAAAAAAASTAASNSTGATCVSSSTSEITLALMKRQRELRLVCAANHSILHRLIQAARRDLQRQEIQRRLAVADADVIEAYNKLESYKVQKRPTLKRDRDAAWKTLKERQKIRAELDAFDKKPP